MEQRLCVRRFSNHATCARGEGERGNSSGRCTATTPIRNGPRVCQFQHTPSLTKSSAFVQMAWLAQTTCFAPLSRLAQTTWVAQSISFTDMWFAQMIRLWLAQLNRFAQTTEFAQMTWLAKTMWVAQTLVFKDDLVCRDDLGCTDNLNAFHISCVNGYCVRDCVIVLNMLH